MEKAGAGLQRVCSKLNLEEIFGAAFRVESDYVKAAEYFE